MPEAIAPGESPARIEGDIPVTEAAFENNPGRVIAALKSAMQHGLRVPQFFGDPIFEDLCDEPRFAALEQELDASLAAEHDKVLQLISFNNPAPVGRQPMPETSEGYCQVNKPDNRKVGMSAVFWRQK